MPPRHDNLQILSTLLTVGIGSWTIRNKTITQHQRTWRVDALHVVGHRAAVVCHVADVTCRYLHALLWLRASLHPLHHLLHHHLHLHWKFCLWASLHASGRHGALPPIQFTFGCSHLGVRYPARQKLLKAAYLQRINLGRHWISSCTAIYSRNIQARFMLLTL